MRNVLIALAVMATPAKAETLRFFPPEGFTGVHTSDTGTVKLTEYVHEGEALDGWTNAITVAEVRGTGLGAVDYVARLSADLATGCSQAFDMDPDIFDAGGRTSTLSLHACPNMDMSGRPEVDLLRVIEGHDGTLFAIQRSWVISPPGEELTEWTDWIRALQVCDQDGCS
ncbi:hypothetical protein SAMN05444004_103116 [Jannaschia faecimaris]|uniref:Uncharacterized protein n=1 Tax=Jannaschia faecimaris TaxID=1244108 RepID=A0A1H3MN35_9RHOB|nr:hypothetical protein [Jannaschia faecimaris]SDY77874.1 hypothetical protein SAMN05444004_103116 [Jannaschia faecimaris]